MDDTNELNGASALLNLAQPEIMNACLRDVFLIFSFRNSSVASFAIASLIRCTLAGLMLAATSNAHSSVF